MWSFAQFHPQHKSSVANSGGVIQKTYPQEDSMYIFSHMEFLYSHFENPSNQALTGAAMLRSVRCHSPLHYFGGEQDHPPSPPEFEANRSAIYTPWS